MKATVIMNNVFGLIFIASNKLLQTFTGSSLTKNIFQFAVRKAQSESLRKSNFCNILNFY